MPTTPATGPRGLVLGARWRRLVGRHSVLLVLLAALLVTFASVPNHDLWTPDEPREAQIGREMLESGLSPMPTLSGEPFVEKPPLFPWAIAASYAVFGVSPGAARVPAALFSTLAVLFAFLMARRAAGTLAGLAAAGVLLTTSKFATTSFSAINDTALTAAVAGGHHFLLAARDRPKRLLPYVFAGLCAAAAFMAKAIIGPILIGAPPVLALLALRDWRTLRALVPRALVLCGVPVLAVAGAWVAALAREGSWDVVKESLVNNTVGRTLGDAGKDFGSYGHSKPPWYYLTAFPGGLLPWSLAIPAAWTSGVLRHGARGGRTLFLALVVLAGIALLSVPAGKRTLYFMPLLPAAAAVFGVWFSRIGSRGGGPWDRATVSLLLGLFGGAAAGAGTLYLVIHFARSPIELLRPLEQAGWLLPFAACLALVASGAAFALLRRLRGAGDRSVLPLALGLGVVATGLVGAVGRPLLDPTEEMRTGSERIAALLPPGDPILGMALTETTQAVVSFYSGRPLRNVAKLAEVDDWIARGAGAALVVEDVKRTETLRRALDARCTLAGRVELDPDDFVLVYHVRPGGVR